MDKMTKSDWLLVDGPAKGSVYRVSDDTYYMQVAHYPPRVGSKPSSFETYAYKRYVVAYGPYQYLVGAIDKDTVSLHEVARLISKHKPEPYKDIDYENMF